MHSCKKSAIIALTNSAVKYVDFVHTFIFVLFALFVIIFAHFYLLFLFPVSTIDSHLHDEFLRTVTLHMAGRARYADVDAIHDALTLDIVGGAAYRG